jgi:hypothetical protein
MAGKALRRLIPLLVVLLIIAGLYWWTRSRRPPPEYSMAYVVDTNAILWNSNAQVRQPVTTLHYGDHVAIMQRAGERADVRGDAGARGWIDESALMDADLWQQAAALLTRAKELPVQARGHTRTISNVRLTAGRDGARIFQFGRNEPVVVLERATGAIPTEGSAEGSAASARNLPKREDWLLILRTPQPPGSAGAAPANGASTTSPASAEAATPAVPIAGWVLARFIDLDPPAPIPDYFSASNIRVVAWEVVSMASDDSGLKPQYLVAGIQGGEGQPCDFTLLRFYTWGAKRQRYETAYVENGICGRMPIRVMTAAADAEFRFADPMENGAERVYRVKQTSVRRVTDASPAAAASSRRQKRR